MAREPVFYSFHYDNDVFRVQQIRNMGVIDGNEPVSPNEWERVRGKGDAAVQKWVDDSMKYKRCVIVLIGAETASRPWVKYEIKRAWELKKGLFGIYIHNLKDPRTGTCAQGPNPFSNWNVGNQSMGNLITCHDPSAWDAYGDISMNMAIWVTQAIDAAKYR
jgi:MTH538 TIR-like domain (DUF1863)